jgi:hypothetical protein
MNPQDEKNFAKVMLTLGEVFAKPLSDVQMDIYFDCLKEYSIEDITNAGKWILKNRTITGTFPLISEFVNAIESRGNLDELAEFAWRIMIQSCNRLGGHRCVEFEDSAITETLRMLGGWCKIGNMEIGHDATAMSLRKEFVLLYKYFKPKNPPKAISKGQDFGCMYACPLYYIKKDGTIEKSDKRIDTIADKLIGYDEELTPKCHKCNGSGYYFVEGEKGSEKVVECDCKKQVMVA